MTRKKKTSRGAHKVRSRGVWIAPDLERKIKGEGGRRGLTEPPYSYYLHLADLVLKPAAAPSGSSAAEGKERHAGAPEPPFEPPSLQNLAPAKTQSRALDGTERGPAPRIDLIPAPLPPLAPALLLPKLNRPKPPRQPRMPKPPKLSTPRPPQQNQRGKLSLPKPPRRQK